MRESLGFIQKDLILLEVTIPNNFWINAIDFRIIAVPGIDIGHSEIVWSNPERFNMPDKWNDLARDLANDQENDYLHGEVFSTLKRAHWVRVMGGGTILELDGYSLNDLRRVAAYISQHARIDDLTLDMKDGNGFRTLEGDEIEVFIRRGRLPRKL